MALPVSNNGHSLGTSLAPIGLALKDLNTGSLTTSFGPFWLLVSLAGVKGPGRPQASLGILTS